MFSYFKSKGKDKNAFTIAFYNLENLFDTVDDPNTFDDDFTSEGKLKWSKTRYQKKIRKLSSVIAKIGIDKSYYPPALIGVAEIENKKVLSDLIHSKNLINHQYGYIQYDSPDMRGIDVGLLYHKELFEPINSMVFPLYLINEEGKRDFTRDVLWVKGYLNNEFVNILVNHWPSRRKGTKESEYKRMEASELNQNIIRIIRNENPDAKIIVMGDFNDNPTNKSLKELVKNDLYNPMERLVDLGDGTLKHKDDWYLFDQIILSNNFLGNKETGHSFKYADVFDKDFLKVFRGKNKDKPFRTYIGRWYQGGFSDHFPVYVYLKRN